MVQRPLLKRSHERQQPARRPSEDRQSRLRQFQPMPFGPRPNALPLHNVRYRSEDGGRTTENGWFSVGRSAFQRRALTRSTKLIFCIGRISRPTRQGSFSLPISVVRSPSSEWWSQTGSNRRPHACKARALPTELWPRTVIGDPSSVTRKERLPITDHPVSDRWWWAWEDLNLRPHAYQARALTN